MLPNDTPLSGAALNYSHESGYLGEEMYPSQKTVERKDITPQLPFLQTGQP